MARGSNAKVEVTNKIAMAFGSNYIGEFDKKLYVWANDGGEKVQIAISMTCPKTLVDADNAATLSGGGHDWSTMPVTEAPEPIKKAEITQEEMDKVAKLMEQLGL